MSRLKKFTRSLVSGYLLLGANIFYTLASVPLALHYLGKAEFGLWALVAQISGYIALIDLGMANSVSRFLIDHKDDPQTGRYGGMIKTSVLVALAQGALIVLAGSGLSLIAGALLHVPAELQREFVWLLVGQSLLTGFSFATRIFGYLLTAHQRMDVPNYGGTILFFLNLAGMWAGLAAGWGVYGFLLGQGAMIFGNAMVNGWGCLRLKLLPKPGEWGVASWAQFRELFAFGRDNFLMGIGWQFVAASQTILLTRLLGLETAAVWSVCTRAYTVVNQLVWRIFDISTPALVEMMVRRERNRLLQRFREITALSASLSVAAGALLAVCNGPFVELWTSGKIHWAPVNDLLLAVSCFFATGIRPHIALAVQTKQFGFLRFVLLAEGLTFVGLNLLAYRVASMTAMLVFSIGCAAAFSFPYGLRRTRFYFRLRWRDLAGWYAPVLRVLLWVAPLALFTWWFAQEWTPTRRLLFCGGLLGLWTGVCLLRHGLPGSLQKELQHRAPDWIRPLWAMMGLTRPNA